MSRQSSFNLNPYCVYCCVIQSNMLSKLYEVPGDGSDLDSRVLSCYELQCTAEAQEGT